MDQADNQSQHDGTTAELDAVSLEARIIRQDRRPFAPIQTWLGRSRKWPDHGDPRRDAANEAVFWWVVRTSIIGGGAVGGVLALVVAVYTAYFTSRSVDALTAQNELLLRQNTSLEAQNELLAQQNAAFVMQNTLSESSRRAALVFELSAILDRVDSESNVWLAARRADQERAGEFDVEFRLSDHLVGRIVAL